MREIGLGKELADSPQKNVVQFIGCVTSESKKPVLYILSCLLFEIYTYFFFGLFFRLGKDRYLHSFIDGGLVKNTEWFKNVHSSLKLQ